MESAPDSSECSPTVPPPLLRFEIPFGLIGLKHLTEFELDAIPNSPPFYRIRALGEEPLELVVLEPHQFLERYPMELSDEDALDLGIHEGTNPLVLTIVAIHSLRPQYVTVNLAAPLLINRETLLGKQVILGGSERYSVSHVLVDERPGLASQAPD
jgi:flagellar assembly factor FliW